MAVDERRNNERVALKKAVIFGLDKPPAHWAYITDISDEGLFIKTNIIYRAGTQLYITLKDEEGAEQQMTGEVMRAKKIPPAFAAEGMSGMGVKLISYDAKLLELLKVKGQRSK